MNYKKTGLRYLILVILLMVSVMFLAATLAADIEPELMQELENKEEVSVIVILEDQGLGGMSIASVNDATDGHDQQEAARTARIRKTQDEVLGKLNIKNPGQKKEEKLQINSQENSLETNKYNFRLGHRFSYVNGFSGKLSKEGLELLNSDPLVKKIYLNRVLKISLDTSVPQINANDVWNLVVAGSNVSGTSETVCVIDTGIDTDHSAFRNKIKDQYCYCSLNNGDGLPCCPDNTIEDSNAEDDNGHGTHISGIAIGNLSTYTGVAKSAGIVAIKSCNAAGYCDTSDVIKGIERCSDKGNISKLNISVISMSMGGGGPYNIYCNNDDPAFTSAINFAVSNNVSVVIASGNDGWANGISSPACIENATPIGAVDSSDNIGYNRGNILDLLAPGVSPIISSYNNGGIASMYGTSMAAPHAAGAFLLFRQYWRLAYGKAPTPQQIEHKFRISGKKVYDANSVRTYSRIDVLRAVQPFVNYTATNPANGTVIASTSVLINITSDVNLSTALLEWNFNNGTTVNYTMQGHNATNFYFNITHLHGNDHRYKIYGNDSAGTFGVSDVRIVIVDTTVPAVIIVNPLNNTNFSSGVQAFNVTITESNIDTVLFSFDNASGKAFNVTTNNASGNWNTNVGLSKFVEGLHTFTVFANDTLGHVNTTESIQFKIDTTPPLIVFNYPSLHQNFSLRSGNKIFNVTVSDALLTVSSVIFIFDNSSGNSFNRTAARNGNYWTASYNVSKLVEGTNIITAVANDTENNINSTVTVNFIVDYTPPTVSFVSPVNGSSFTFASGIKTFKANVSDVRLAIDAVLFSFDNASGKAFNVTTVNSGGLWTANYNVSTLADGLHTVTVFANDTVGNVNNTAQLRFTVDTTTPIVNLSSPVNGYNSSHASVSFRCSAIDNKNLNNIVLYGNWKSGWHANQTIAVSGTSSSVVFTKTLPQGTYIWSCRAYDADANNAFSLVNYTLIVDLTFPKITSVSSGSLSTTSATITWTTNEQTNSSVNYGTSAALGTPKSILAYTYSHSISLSGLSASTLYYYNVTSCDYAGNCNTSGPLYFTTSSNGGGDNGNLGGGGGGGGSGGGGGGSNNQSVNNIITTAAETIVGETPADDATKNSVSDETVQEVAEVVSSISSDDYSQTVTLLGKEPVVIEINNPKIPITKLEISSKVEKEIVVKVSFLSEKPEEISPLKNSYGYLNINIDLNEEEIENAKLIFTVSKEWILANNYSEKKVVLQTFQEGEWEKLKTKLISENEGQFVYEAKVKHFSYFAITAAEGEFGSLVTGFFSAVMPTEIQTEIYVLLGVVILIILLIVVYYRIIKEE